MRGAPGGTGPRARRRNPVPVESRFHTHVLLGDGKPEQALEALQRSAKLDPGYTYAAVGLGMTYEQLGRLEEAVRSMLKVVELTKTRNQELASLARRELNRLQELQAKAQH